MKLAIYSDLHTEHSAFEPPSNLDVDLIVLAGDIHTPGHTVPQWARRANRFGDRPVVHVSGNHEFYGGELLAQSRKRRSLGRARPRFPSCHRRSSIFRSCGSTDTRTRASTTTYGTVGSCATRGVTGGARPGATRICASIPKASARKSADFRAAVARASTKMRRGRDDWRPMVRKAHLDVSLLQSRIYAAHAPRMAHQRARLDMPEAWRPVVLEAISRIARIGVVVDRATVEYGGLRIVMRTQDTEARAIEADAATECARLSGKLAEVLRKADAHLQADTVEVLRAFLARQS